jgi:YebC/PmpR family DNA-binding regulatory protein
MSGHSKWANIQRKKGKTDAERAKLFTKISREMIVAVKSGGSANPLENSRLKDVIAKAKAANVPNDNIKRILDKASASDSDSYEANVYEGYGPGGVAVIVETLTDNRNRTASEIRHYFDKYGGNMGAAGCVSWSFDRKGIIVIESEGLNEDEVMMDALEAGAEDLSVEDEAFEIVTAPEKCGDVISALEAKGYVFASAGVEMVPQNYTKLTTEEAIRNMEKLIDALEENDDVQNVYHNWDQE